MQLLFQIHFFSSWVCHDWGRQTACRGCICTYLQSTSQPLDPTGACNCSVMIQRIESCLQQLAGRNKAKRKGKKPMLTNIPTPAGDLGDELSEHHTRPMHGRGGSGHGGRSSTNSCWWPAWQPTTLAERGQPTPHPVPSAAGKSSSYLLNSHPVGSRISIDLHSASASIIAEHKKKVSWAWLHSSRLPCTFKMKKFFLFF